MNKTKSEFLTERSDGHLMFYCPGCKTHHDIRPQSPQAKGGWQIHSFNPLTVSPSILVSWEWGPNYEKRRCHSFIKNDQIQFLNDCTHDLAGKTVPMVKIQ